MSGGTIVTRDTESTITARVDVLSITTWGMTQDSRSMLTPRLDTGEQHVTKLPPLGKQRTVQVIVADLATADALSDALAASYHVNITVPPGPSLDGYRFQDAKVIGQISAQPAASGSRAWAVTFTIQTGATS